MFFRKPQNVMNKLKGGLISGLRPTKSALPASTITKDDLWNIAFGFGISASGGGGSFLQGLEIANKALDDGFDSIELLNPADISVDEKAFVSGGMGKPESLDDPVAFGNKVTQLLQKLETYLENLPTPSAIKGILPVEAGPLNGLLPIYSVYNYNTGVEESKKIFLFDCDGAGRAVPSMTTCMYDFFENGTCPMAYNFVTDNNVTRNILLQSSEILYGADAEQIFSSVMLYGDQNESIPFICWQFDFDMAKEGVKFPTGTYSYWMKMGALFKKCYRTKDGMLAFLKILNAANPSTASEFNEKYWVSKVDGIVQFTNDRWDCGYIVFDKNDTSEMRLYYVNENLTVSEVTYATDTSPATITNKATAPSSITTFFYDACPCPDPDEKIPIGPDEVLESGYIPYNTGDIDKIVDLCNANADVIIAVTDPTIPAIPENPNYLYEPKVCNRFIDVMNSTFAELEKENTDVLFPPQMNHFWEVKPWFKPKQ